jgi:hypothetical protein
LAPAQRRLRFIRDNYETYRWLKSKPKINLNELKNSEDIQPKIKKAFYQSVFRRILPWLTRWGLNE